LIAATAKFPVRADPKPTGDILFLTCVRPMDNFVWTYRCRIEGNRVVWATEPGRWRDDPKDDEVFFEVVGAGKELRLSTTTEPVRVQNSCLIAIRFYESARPIPPKKSD
jgi:hypothetical protein